MTDGWWRIKQFSPGAPTGFAVTEIPVRPNPEAHDPEVASPTIPWWLHDTLLDGPCLTLAWDDGREEYFPWASIIHAEYQPPTNDHPDQAIPEEDW